ncbi:MAG: DUF4340 domain-containing protein [Myxococcus sp.]|nr:DUF4340 domain-containing protein [Myxococcus sp.]
MNQMQKTLVALVGLVVVAAGVGLFAYKGVYEKDERAASKKADQERLFATGAEPGRGQDAGAARIEFTKLTVSAGSDTTVLERAPGEPWRITSPVKARVDPLVIDGVVSQLQTARFKTTLEGEATDAELKTYGLDAPSFSVVAEATVGGQPRTVKLEGGIENPFDGTVYIRRDDSRVIHMAEGGVRWSLAKTTFDLREKDLFSIDEPKLQRLAFKSKSNDWELVRGDDKLWRLTRPEATLADTVTVQAVLGSIRGERALAFPADATDAALKALGFDAPLATATFALSSGEVKITLATPPLDAGSAFYALREDADGRVLAQVNATARTAFDRNAMELRDKSLMPFARQLVTKIVISTPGSPEVVAERESADASIESWRVTSPKSGPAKGYRIASTLWTLSAIKAGSVVFDQSDAKVLETYSLDAKSARTIRLFGPGNVELAALVLGKELVGKSGSSYAMGARKAIVEIDSSRFNELPWSADDLIDAPSPDAGP